ncbi:MAG: hypothetical protein A2W90_08370 [Bacteroidetes bacterium GWF2_42_66]|nr:MAG: hypothetical protein A2W92_15060 [Bacteroidetes bacterium GWA2_42_15]OFX96487.1 MAG: hypothetical protein A2W89_06030 [Bacteroidetes bacterium GWE2_42_39]OFY40907.1 MAG: hypothetical protein A2W90_08370 [Bacteroidetes bacterium GWF2_42_66]HBL76339.1 hypothetical protein [Prolixibacteraceae bacterium]HCR92107.1 hypothetical protein [Prolixibacteraceae bacterium]
MKKLIILTIIILASVGLKAQNAAPKFTVTPSDIDALTENVTIVFDVTGSAVEGVTDIYIWAWGEGLNPAEMLLCYDEGSPSWGSISKNAKLDPVAGEPNKRILKLPKTVTRAGTTVTFNNVAELFGVGDTPGKIKKFGFLLRSQDGSKQTPGDMATSVTLLPLEFEASYFRTFPAKVSNKDVVTAYLNLNLLESSEDQKLKIAGKIKASISLLTTNGTKILTTELMSTTYTAQGEYAVSFLPEKLGTFPTGTSISNVAKCQLVFSGEVYEQGGTAQLVNTKTFEFEFQQYE